MVLPEKGSRRLISWFTTRTTPKVPWLMRCKAGTGKSQVAIIALMMHSLYWHAREDAAGEPSIYSVPDLDFLRGHAGTRTMPVLFDDGDLPEQTMKAFKAVTDVRAHSPMVHVRWDATSFAQSQARAITDNAFDEPKANSLEEKLALNSNYIINYKEFVYMVILEIGFFCF